MAIADMFLKLEGCTGECGDAEFKDAIELVSWNWGLQSRWQSENNFAAVQLNELQIVKRVDRASPTLMQFVSRNVLVKTGTLTVRKAGKVPLSYFTVDLKDVRVTSVKIESQNAELVERVNLAFVTVKVEYKPQGPTGAQQGGGVTFETSATGSPR